MLFNKDIRKACRITLYQRRDKAMIPRIKHRIDEMSDEFFGCGPALECVHAQIVDAHACRMNSENVTRSRAGTITTAFIYMLKLL